MPTCFTGISELAKDFQRTYASVYDIGTGITYEIFMFAVNLYAACGTGKAKCKTWNLHEGSALTKSEKVKGKRQGNAGMPREPTRNLYEHVATHHNLKRLPMSGEFKLWCSGCARNMSTLLCRIKWEFNVAKRVCYVFINMSLVAKFVVDN